jgi:hypothetical protein
LLPGRSIQQRFGSAKDDLRVLKLSFELAVSPLLPSHPPEMNLLKPIERFILLDLGALGKEPLIEKGRNARDEIDALDRLNPADIFARLRDSFADRGDDTNHGRLRRRLLRDR